MISVPSTSQPFIFATERDVQLARYANALFNDRVAQSELLTWASLWDGEHERDRERILTAAIAYQAAHKVLDEHRATAPDGMGGEALRIAEEALDARHRRYIERFLKKEAK